MTWYFDHLVSLLIFVPLLSAVFLTVFPKDADRSVKIFTFVSTLLTFFISLCLYSRFDLNSVEMQFVENRPWITSLWTSSYHVGLDGLSIYLVLLTTFLMPLATLVSFKIHERAKEFFIFMLILESAVIGAFASLDLLLFYIFWEAMLIPMYFWIGIWGGKSRLQTSIKFFLFTIAGSLLLFLGILALYHQAGGSFDLQEIARHPIPLQLQYCLLICFGVAFLVKVPAFPLHSWLPDTHTEAPTAGSLILAAVLLKLGIYGLLRFCFPLFGEAILNWQMGFLVIGAIGVVYGSLLSWVQTDIKRLVAYSSIAHMGTILIGIFSFNKIAMTGALFHMISHGLTTGGLFILIGILYERTHTREMSHYGGVAKAMVLLSTAFFIVTLGSVGLPGTNGFVGEFLILIGTFKEFPLIATVGGLGVVLGAVYMLRLYQNVFFGATTELVEREKRDLNFREMVIILPVIALIIAFGVKPSLILKPMERAIAAYAKAEAIPSTMETETHGENGDAL